MNFLKRTLLLLFFVLSVINWELKAQFSENFDTGVPGSMTQVYINNSINWTDCGGDSGPATCPYNGTGSAHFFENSNSGSQTALVTPVLDLSNDSYMLEFSHVQPVWSGDQNILTVEISMDSGANWTQVEEYTNDISDWADELIFLDNFNLTATTQIRFIGTNHWGYAIGLDDIVIEPVPSCFPVSDISVSATSPVSVNLSWTENGNATAWNIEYGLTGFTQGQGTVIAALSNPFNITGLASQTAYDFYVQADCGGGDVSTWTGPYTFNTACNPVSTFPYNFGFENVLPNTGGDWLSSCWSANPENTGSNNYQGPYRWTVTEGYTETSSTGPNNANGGTRYAYTEATGSNNGDVAVLKSPFFDLSSLSQPQLSFYYHMYGGDIGTLLVDVFDGTTWTEGVWSISGEQQTSSEEPWQLAFVNLSNTVTQIRFRAIRGNGYKCDIAIDDISLQETPSCQPPTNLSATSISHDSAELSWDGNGSSVWNIEFGPTGFSQGSGMLVNGITSNSYTISGLLIPHNDYDFYVQANCNASGGTGNTIWVGPFTWKQLSEGDDCSIPIIGNVVQDCSQSTPQSIDFSNAISEFNPSCVGSYYSKLGYWFKVSMPNSGSLAINNTDNDYGLVVLDACGGTELVCETNLSGSYTLQLTNYANSNLLLYMWKDSRSGTADICFEEVTCLPPIDLSATQITETSTEISWTEIGAATTWNIKYGYANTPSSMTTINGITSNSYTLTNLFTRTNYEFYVQPNCGGGNTGPWAGPFTWRQYQEGRGCSFPLFGTVVQDCTQSTPMVLSMTGADGAYYPSCNYLGSYGYWIKLTWPASGSLIVNNSGNTNVGLTVYDSCGGTELYCFTNINNAIALTDSNLSGTDVMMFIWNFSATGIAQICFEEGTCPYPTDLFADNIHQTAARLSWVENGSATTWNLEYGPTGFTPGQGTTIPTSSNPYNLFGLTPYTTYDFYVQADCGGGDTSNRQGPYTFTTHCSPISAPFTDGFESGDFGCWVNEITTDQLDWTVISGPTPSNDTGPSSAHSGNYYIYVESSYPANTNYKAILYSPEIDISSLSSPRLNFYYHMYGFGMYPDGYIDVAISENGGATYTSVFHEVGNHGDQWNHAIIDLSLLPYSTVVQFKITAKISDNSNVEYNDFAIDDFMVEEGPSCPAPTDLSVNNITSNSVDLSWTENGSATTWNIEYGPVGFTPGQGTIIMTSANLYTLIGLSPLTNYDVYVQADCGGGDTSTWVGPVTITTLCAVFSAPYTESFENNIDCWTSGNSQLDWTVHSGATPSNNTGPDSAYDGTNYLYVESSGSSHGDTAVIYSPEIDLSSLTSPGLVFYYHMYGAGMYPDGSIDVAISTDGGSTYTGIFNEQSNHGNQWNQAVVSLSGYSGIVMFKITGTISSSGVTYENDFAIDDFSVLEATNSVDELAGITSIYPNPTKGQFVIKSQSLNNAKVFVYTITGKEIFNDTIDKDDYIVNLKNLKRGVYLVKITSENKFYVSKLIVK